MAILTDRKERELTRGKFINGELTWESWEGSPNEIGEKVYARCVELNIFAGPCSSLWAAINALAIAALIRIEQLGFRKPIQYFRAALLTKRG